MKHATIKNTPSIFLPYQQAWVADTSAVKIFVKSRRIGGSWAEAGESALEASRQNGQDTWYIGYAKDMAIEFIRDVADWAKYYQLAAGEIEESEEVFIEGDEKKSILAYTIKFASGWRVTALSSAPRNLRGKQGRVIIDEAAFHDNLGELLKAAFALLIWGGCVRIISTHNGVTNPFNQLVEDVKAGRLPYSLHQTTFDEALEQGLYKRICLKLGREWTAEGEAKWANEIREIYADNLDEELNCIPKNSGGKWLSRALIESRMTPDVPILLYKRGNDFNLQTEALRIADCNQWCVENIQPIIDNLPNNAKCFVGGDYGRNGDLTVFPLAIRTTGLVLECQAIFELENIPFSQQEQVLNYICDGLIDTGRMLLGMALDAGGIGASNSEKAQQRYGASVVECVKFSNAWYALNMPPFKAALEDGTVDNLPRHENVLSDLSAFEVIDGVPKLPKKKNKGKDNQDRHGDIGTALVLMHYANRTLNDGALTIGSRPSDTDNSVQQGIGLLDRFKNMIRGYD
ncbi:terminase large subunit domain-containing protein [Psychrobacter lutiphocae]|uniref:terminase large subunit domain-containing protein n=1 Tax=Psychrobacter lutiphocae TaxID=540500 RepID=UPI000382504C|nr:terminase family protein [Psychrobacter lutiphocae]